MHPRTQELLQHLDTQFEHLRQTVQGIPREGRGVKPAPDRWSVAEILEHLSIVEGRIERLLATKVGEARAAGLGEDRETSPVVGTIDMARMLDRTRPIMSSESARPTGTLDAEAAWSALEHVHAKLVQTVRGSDGLALGTIAVPHPVLGPINLYQWISFVGGHEARHAAQIAELQPSPVGS